MPKINRHVRLDLLGFFISLAVLCRGAAAVAGGLTEFAVSANPTPMLIGTFSAAELDQLGDANAAETTASRLAALGVDMPSELKPTATPTPAGNDVHADADLFPHSGSVLSLLVTRPDAATPVARISSTLRPGLVQPVGVSSNSLRRAPHSPRFGR